MKSLFHGYYVPSEDQFKQLWKTGLIVLDTNVLLEIYRLPQQAREELLGVLSSSKARLWIPYQVAMEFQRNRITVIAAERKKIDDALTSSEKNFTALQSTIEDLKLDRRNLSVDLKEMDTALLKAKANVILALQKAQEKQPDIALVDPIRDAFDELFEGRVGIAPSKQEEVAELCAEGDARFKKKIPPGYMDSEKGNGPDEGQFAHKGLIYDRKFGDLILWRQLLEFLKNQKHTEVMLITGDQKEDWWWREKGKTFGPKQDLVDEIQSLVGVRTFWIYTPELFLKGAQTYMSIQVSPESLEQLKEISEDSTVEESPSGGSRGGIDSLTKREDRVMVEAVRQWLSIKYKVRARHFLRGAPTLIAQSGNGTVGYQIVDTRGKSERPLEILLLRATLLATAAKREQRLKEIHIICCGTVAGSTTYSPILRMMQQGELESFTWGDLVGDEFVERTRITQN